MCNYCAATFGLLFKEVDQTIKMMRMPTNGPTAADVEALQQVEEEEDDEEEEDNDSGGWEEGDGEDEEDD